MSRGPDVLARLSHALIASAPAPMAIGAATSVEWASATFAGARHRITLRSRPTERDAFDAWIAGLPAAEFVLRDSLVADVTVVAVRRAGPAAVEVDLEVLTVDCEG
jgi:hypothetical protein